MSSSLSAALARKFDQQEHCDIMFTVAGNTIGAHKLVIQTRSPVLYELIFEWSPQEDPVSIQIMDFDSFKMLLRYIYTDKITITDQNVFMFLSAATHYKILQLEEDCAEHISTSMTPENVCIYMNEAINFDSAVIQEKCRKLFLKETADVVVAESFMNLTQEALSAFLDVNSISMLEMDLFHYIREWMEQKCKDRKLLSDGTNMRKVIDDALYKIRFPTMTSQDFGNYVATLKGLLTNNEMLQIFLKITVLDNGDVECPFSSELRYQTEEIEEISDDNEDGDDSNKESSDEDMEVKGPHYNFFSTDEESEHERDEEQVTNDDDDDDDDGDDDGEDDDDEEEALEEIEEISDDNEDGDDSNKESSDEDMEVKGPHYNFFSTDEESEHERDEDQVTNDDDDDDDDDDGEDDDDEEEALENLFSDMLKLGKNLLKEENYFYKTPLTCRLVMQSLLDTANSSTQTQYKEAEAVREFQRKYDECVETIETREELLSKYQEIRDLLQKTL